MTETNIGVYQHHYHQRIQTDYEEEYKKCFIAFTLKVFLLNKIIVITDTILIYVHDEREKILISQQLTLYYYPLIAFEDSRFL